MIAAVHALGSQALEGRWLRTILVGLAVTLAPLAAIQPLLALDKAARNESAVTRDFKVATVDMAHILRKWYAVHPVYREHKGLQEGTDDRANRLQRLHDRIQASSTFFEKACLIVKRRLLLNEMIKEFNRLKRESQEKEDAARESVRKEIGLAVERVAVNRGIDLIVDKHCLYYPRNAVDLTLEVINRLDLKVKAKRSRRQPDVELEEE